MTWYLKARDNNGVVYPILCDELMQVFDNLKDQSSRGLEAWTEDHEGKPTLPCLVENRNEMRLRHLVLEPSILHVYKFIEQPTVIGYCVIPADYDYR